MAEKRKYLQIFLLIVIIAGCGSRAGLDSYHREEVPLDFITNVAVLPLENNTDESHVHKLVRDVVNTQVLALGIFNAVDPGVVDQVLHEEAVEQGEALSQLMLQRLGNRLEVQAFILGAVNIAGSRRIGSVGVPEISISMRLVEARSGTILWQASGHNDGDSIMARLLGITPPDRYEVTMELVRRLLYTIPERVEPLFQQAE